MLLFGLEEQEVVSFLKQGLFLNDLDGCSCITQHFHNIVLPFSPIDFKAFRAFLLTYFSRPTSPTGDHLDSL